MLRPWRACAPLVAPLLGCAGLGAAHAVRRAGTSAVAGGSCGNGTGGGVNADSDAGRDGVHGSDIAKSPLDLRSRGWRILPARLEMKDALIDLMLDFLPTHYLLVVGNWEHVDGYSFELELVKLAVSFIVDPFGRLRPNRAHARRLHSLHYPCDIAHPDSFFSHDRFFVDCQRGGVMIWQMPYSSLATPARSNVGGMGKVQCVSSDGKWFVFGDTRGFISLWDATRGDLSWAGDLRSAFADPEEYIARFSPDGGRIALVTSRLVAVLHASRGDEMCRYEVGMTSLREQMVVFTGNRVELCNDDVHGELVSLSVAYSMDGCLIVRDRPSMPCSRVVAAGGEAWVAHFMPPGTLSFKSIENASGDAQLPIFGRTVSCKRFRISPDGRSVLILKHSGSVALWRFSEKREPIDIGVFETWRLFDRQHVSEDGEVMIMDELSALLDLESGAQISLTSDSDIALSDPFSDELLSVSRLRCSGTGMPA